MNEYDLMNLYFNFIFKDGNKSFRYVYASYEQLVEFKNWLTKQNIKFPFVHQIQKNECELLFRSKNFETYDTAFKTSYAHDFHKYIAKEKEKYQVILLLGIDQQFFENFDNSYNHDLMRVFRIKKALKEDISLYGPFHLFLNALYQIDRWPGVFIFKGEQSVFYPVKNIEEVKECFRLIETNKIFEKKCQTNEDQYFIQLSDLHLGTKKTDNGLIVLQDSLDELYHMLPHDHQLKFLITGDLMNSPNRKNMYEASNFMKLLKNKYSGDVSFILGNHDVIVNGFNIFKRQKSKVIAFLLNESIKVFEKEKIILIKIDSTVEGNLARGKIGKKQLDNIDEELASIKNLKDYTMVAMLHHHLFPITRDEFLKQKWREKMFVGKIMDSSKALVDSQDLIEWFRKHQIQYVLHGHKHLPFFTNHDGMYVIAAGSSCGSGAKESDSRYLSYNVLKYDHRYKRFKYCFIIYDDMTLQDRQRIIVNIF